MRVCGKWKLLLSLLGYRNGRLFKIRWRVLLFGVLRVVKALLLARKDSFKWLDMTSWLTKT